MTNKIIVYSEVKVNKLIFDIKRIIAHHENMKYSYFRESPRSAEKRRLYEFENSIGLNFIFDKYDVNLKCLTQCSKKNIYYKWEFIINSERKNITFVKKILKEIQEH